jgi:RimJ/RimL family protein N-acetyltransferase
MTARLAFRTWRDSDGELAVALWGDADVARYITAFDGPPSRASCLERLHRELACQAEHGFQYWPAFVAGGELVGCAGLRPYRDGVLELGVHLRPAHWRRGYADELGRAVIAHAFGALAARALFAGHHPDNAASRGMLAKLGFRFSHDELYPPTGLVHPSYLLERPA